MVEIYLDAADLASIDTFIHKVDGVTTNPSIMRKAGITNYREFSNAVLAKVCGKPVSFEVLADDFPTMESQAHEIASWGDNVWVKIPITNTKGESSIDLIDSLSDLNLNITAVMTQAQIDKLATVDRSHHIISVFAGRIMDASQLPPIKYRSSIKAKFLWASARETYHVDMATNSGYDIITLTPELIAKLPIRGKDLAQYSLETVKQFYEDGKSCVF
jgi:transaldolase